MKLRDLRRLFRRGRWKPAEPEPKKAAVVTKEDAKRLAHAFELAKAIRAENPHHPSRGIPKALPLARGIEELSRRLGVTLDTAATALDTEIRAALDAVPGARLPKLEVLVTVAATRTLTEAGVKMPPTPTKVMRKEFIIIDDIPGPGGVKFRDPDALPPHPAIESGPIEDPEEREREVRAALKRWHERELTDKGVERFSVHLPASAVEEATSRLASKVGWPPPPPKPDDIEIRPMTREEIEEVARLYDIDRPPVKPVKLKKARTSEELMRDIEAGIAGIPDEVVDRVMARAIFGDDNPEGDDE